MITKTGFIDDIFCEYEPKIDEKKNTKLVENTCIFDQEGCIHFSQIPKRIKVIALIFTVFSEEYLNQNRFYYHKNMKGLFEDEEEEEEEEEG